MQSAKANHEQIKAECENQFNEVVPKLKVAIHGLQKLQKGEIAVVRSIKKPTQCVYVLMQCVTILMNIEQKPFRKVGDNGQYFIDWWAMAQSVHCLGNP